MHSSLMSEEIEGVAIVAALAAVFSPTHAYHYSPHSHLPTLTPPTHSHLLTHTYSPSLTLTPHPHPHSLMCGAGDAAVSMRLMVPIASAASWMRTTPSSTTWDTPLKPGVPVGLARPCVSECVCLCLCVCACCVSACQACPFTLNGGTCAI